MSNAGPLEKPLAALRRRITALASLSGLGWALLAAAAVWFVFGWFDLLWELSPGLRIAANTLAVVAAISGLTLAIWQAKTASHPLLLARRLDEAGSTGGQIRSGYDLAVEPTQGAASSATVGRPPMQGDETHSELRRGLAQLSVRRAAKLAADISPARVISSRPLRITLGTLCAVGVCVAILAVFMPRLAATQWLRFTDPTGDHPPYEHVQIAVEPGDTQVLYGHGLEIKATTAGPPVEQLDLVLQATSSEPEEVLPMFPESDGHWRGVLSRVTTPTQYFVRAGRARSPRYGLELVMTPRLESVRFRITPPAYTHHSPYDGPLPRAGIAGLKGTKVEAWAKSNRPLSGGSIEIATDHGRIPVLLKPVSGDEQQVSGSFEIRSTGKLELGIVDTAGHENQEKLTAAVTLLKDESPLIRILQPQHLSFATPEATLPIVLAGEDDYGISRVQLFRSLNDSRALPQDFPLGKTASPRFNGNEALPLSAYGLSPGDAIKLFARIEDNDPDGAKGFETPLVEVRIISQEEFENMLREREGLDVLMSKYRAAERRLEALQAAEEGLRKKLKETQGDKMPEAMRDELKRLARQLHDEAEEIRKSAKHLLPYDADHKLSQQLEELAQKLEKASKRASDLENEANISREEMQKLLDQMATDLGDERKELDSKVLDPLEGLERVFPLIEDSAQFESLYQQQRDLANRLAALKGHDHQDNPAEKARMRDLEAEQRRIHKALEQVLDDIDDHLQQLPEGEALDPLRKSAREFVDKVRESGAVEAMADAESGLAEFSGTRGHESRCESRRRIGEAARQKQKDASQGT